MATQARSNIAVSNDCTSNVFTPNVKIAINDMDRTSAVQVATLRITLNRNEELDSAEFTINRDEGFTPTAGQLVEIGLGDSENLIFGGQISTLAYVREQSGDFPRFHVVCRDWASLFNRRRITNDFSGQSATDIATAIVEDYTSGFFTYGIKAGMAMIDEFFCINETPLGALRRIANLMKGGCDIGPTRIVHVWDSGGPSSYYTPSYPATLTNSLHSLKAFVPKYDVSQWRSRVIVEGKRTTCPLPIPADVSLPSPGVFPVEDSTAFSVTGGSARIGTQVVTYTSTAYPVVPGVSPEGTHVTADAAAGATSVEINDNAFVFSTGSNWCRIGEQVIFFGGTDPGPPVVLNSIPSSGLGSIAHAIGTGESVTALGELIGVSGLTLEQPRDVEVVVREEVDDSSAQTAIAAIEGGDGIHEHFVSDGRLSYVGCLERANNELDTFSDTLLSAEWVTHDMQTVPGTLQVINLSSPSVLSATLLVDSVSLEFHKDNTLIASSPTSPCDSNLWPRRRATGSTVKLATFFDEVLAG
jgi:hypothetical protein